MVFFIPPRRSHVLADGRAVGNEIDGISNNVLSLNREELK